MLDIVLCVILTTAASTFITHVLSKKKVNLNLAVITMSEWTAFQEKVNQLPTPLEFNRVRSLAESASMICEGMLPDSGIKAHSFDGETVITGMPAKG